MSSRGRAAGPQTPQKSKSKLVQYVVLDMKRIKEQLRQKNCPCQNGKNPHSFCVLHCVLYMIPVCRNNVRCKECIFIIGEQDVKSRSSMSDQFSHLNQRLTREMMQTYVDTMANYRLQLS